MKNPAFVLGNGKSRLQIDLHVLRHYGKIYGCNALFREFIPDILIATDRPMATEIEESGYSEKNEFWTRIPSPEHSARKIDINYGFSSGPIAISLAARYGHNPIYLLGFDLTGVNGKINNIYAGTPNYRPLTDKETFWGNWVLQIHTIMKDQFPYQKYIRVNDSSYTPIEWKSQPNYSEISYPDFVSSINNKLWQRQNE